mmetsp:Transcript_25701/g.61206  ORF Transcript_25701/g.61206 Transcript_25701/m.61206 type:complete len:314 (+) Transcript_25701:274-1215(+)
MSTIPVPKKTTRKSSPHNSRLSLVSAVFGQKLEAPDPLLASAQRRLGRTALKEGNLEVAVATLADAIRTYTSTKEVFKVADLAAAKSELAEALRRKAKYAEAESLFREALEVQLANEEIVDDEEIATTLAGLGYVLSLTGPGEEASKLLSQAVEVAERMENSYQMNFQNLYLETAESFERLGEVSKALKLFQKVALSATSDEISGDDTAPRVLAALASCLAKVGNLGKEAELASVQSVWVAKTLLNESDPRLAYFLARRAGLLSASNRSKIAGTVFPWLVFSDRVFEILFQAFGSFIDTAASSGIDRESRCST